MPLGQTFLALCLLVLVVHRHHHGLRKRRGRNTTGGRRFNILYLKLLLVESLAVLEVLISRYTYLLHESLKVPSKVRSFLF